MHEPFGDLDSTLRGWVEERDLAGAALLTRGGDTLFTGAWGPAERATGTPVTRGTRFGLASVTKMFTAVAVVDLVREGLAAYDTRVLDVLPPHRRPSTLRSDVTLHHLLCHTSGIADYAEEDEDTPGYVKDYAAIWADRPVHAILGPADFLPLFGDLPPYRPPGQLWQYSNAGYLVLGLVIEELAGATYTQVVQQRVFDRAQMTSSGFFRLDEPRADIAVGYPPRASPDAPWRTNVYAMPVVGGADGGAFSTLHDLDRFLRAYDTTLLGDHHDLVLSRHADAGNGFFSGYGVHLYPDGRFGHGGSDPGVDVLVHRWPEDDVDLVVLCSMEGLAGEVRDLLVQAWRT